VRSIPDAGNHLAPWKGGRTVGAVSPVATQLARGSYPEDGRAAGTTGTAVRTAAVLPGGSRCAAQAVPSAAAVVSANSPIATGYRVGAGIRGPASPRAATQAWKARSAIDPLSSISSVVRLEAAVVEHEARLTTIHPHGDGGA